MIHYKLMNTQLNIRDIINCIWKEYANLHGLHSISNTPNSQNTQISQNSPSSVSLLNGKIKELQSLFQELKGLMTHYTECVTVKKCLNCAICLYDGDMHEFMEYYGYYRDQLEQQCHVMEGLVVILNYQ
eukprot:NODE_1152_length_1990_cov_0.816456.p3 type:complete len:129 gc:universal NODE_1152_length_1990_cov_0.816456:1543-1157(-)